MTKRLTLEDIKKYIEKYGEGDKFYGGEYERNTSILTITCHICEKQYSMSWASYRTGYRHAECQRKIGNEHRKLLKEDVIKTIESRGCSLLSEYNGIDENMMILFSCGHTGKRNFYSFKKSKGICSKCCGNEKYVLSDIESILLNTDYSIAHEQEYKNNKERMTFLDSEGYKYYISFGNVLSSLKRKKHMNPFHSRNIFCLDNMKLWLKKNNKSWDIECEEYISCLSSNLKFTCNDCGFHWKAAWSRIYSLGTGCPNCAIKKLGESVAMARVTEEYNFKSFYPYLSEEWNYEKNIKPPELYSPGSNQKVWWKCEKCNGEWEATISSRVRGNGCPVCGQSGGEKRIYWFLKNNNLNFNRQQTFDDLRSDVNYPLRFDFGIINDNKVPSVIEFDGKQHYIYMPFMHETKEAFHLNQRHDEIKNLYCEEKGIQLIRIPYWEFKNIESILSKELNLIKKEDS
jgi:very-short-patch-repair endonuclease/predicted RNA-binding Zn-ribbon protein involved in translation (DUF1610 family)